MKKFLIPLAVFFSAILYTACAAQIIPPPPNVPCQWQYGFVSGVATATYCGNATVQGSLNPASQNTVFNIAALSALPSPINGAVYYVKNYSHAGDGGGGNFLFTTAVFSPDACVNFAASVTGTWIRQLNGAIISVEMCGAYNDNTHATETHAAFAAATNYVQNGNAGLGPNQKIHIPFGTYNLGAGTSGVEISNASWCPNYYGDGPGNTNISYSPSAEGAAFLFDTSLGQCNGGGVTNLRVTGNTHTVGCEFLSVSGGYCRIGIGSVEEAFLNCSCTANGFTENNKFQILGDADISFFSTRVLEYRTANGGTGSHRESGIDQISYISAGSVGGTIVTISAGSVVYSAPLQLSVNNQSGTTLDIFQNLAGNSANFYGNIQVEADGAGSTTFLSGAGLVVLSGGLNVLQTSNLAYGEFAFATIAGFNGAGVSFGNIFVPLEGSTSQIQYLGAGTAHTTILAEGVTPPNGQTCKLNLSNGVTYNWSGNVTILAGTAGFIIPSGGVLGNLFFDTGSLGAPTFGITAGGTPTITVPGAVSASTIAVTGSCQGAADNL